MNPKDAASEEQIPQTGELEPALTLRIPDGARIPEGATFYEGEDDTRCRLIAPDGQRCRATRVRRYGLCGGHSGTGISANPAAYSAQGHTERRRRATARATLGISTRRAAQPLQASRIRAQIRADDYAKAVVDDPLDDASLSSTARQQAAIKALELLYPQVHASVDVTLPQEEGEIQGMDWQSMQALAAQLTSQP